MNIDIHGQGSVQVTGLILEELNDLSLEDVCRACGVASDRLLELVEEGAIVPMGGERVAWRFTGMHLRHARVAIRLQRDLGVNAAGAALALQLMEELDQLRARLQAMGAQS